MLLRHATRPSIARAAVHPRVACLSSAPSTKTLHLLLYSYVENAQEVRKPHRKEHLELARTAQTRGEMLLAGALAKPVDGAVFIFSGGAAAAENFAKADPYVREGVVTGWDVREWTAVVGTLFPQVPLPPPPPAFVPTYDWQPTTQETVLPPGLEIELRLDGGGAGRARIPPEWTLALGMNASDGSTWRMGVTRATTVGEMRQLVSERAGCEPADVHITIEGNVIGLDKDDLTVEQTRLFERQNALSVTAVPSGRK